MRPTEPRRRLGYLRRTRPADYQSSRRIATSERLGLRGLTSATLALSKAPSPMSLVRQNAWCTEEEKTLFSPRSNDTVPSLSFEPVKETPLNNFRATVVKLTLALGILFKATNLPAQSPVELPILRLPDAKIVEVYRGNWVNTLAPCKVPADAARGARASQHAEPERPWKVDVNGHYPGWYPGVDVKHQAV